MIRATLLILSLAGPAAAAELAYRFTWLGAGGYALTGALSFDARFAEAGLVGAGDLTCFVIEGRRDGQEIGRWALGALTPQTTWRLHFDPAAPGFVVEGQGIAMPQAWNMDGAGTDCGPGGFGFNIGNAAQDLCLDGRLLTASQIDPERPFPAEPAPGFAFPPDACRGPELLSRHDPGTAP
jgi:hypothetical protein